MKRVVKIKNIHTLITYEFFEKLHIGTINRRCIDGSIHGCSSCKGYCNFNDHPGYLTEKMIAEKHCIEKGCHYFVGKPKSRRQPKRTNIDREIIAAASAALSPFEGLRVTKAKQDETGRWILYYAQIADYNTETLCESISSQCDFSFSLSPLPCSFDTAAQLVFGKVR